MGKDYDGEVGNRGVTLGGGGRGRMRKDENGEAGNRGVTPAGKNWGRGPDYI